MPLGRLVRAGSSAVALLPREQHLPRGHRRGPGDALGRATAAPLDYGNANGALLAVGATAAVGALVLSRGWVRALAGVEAVILLVALPRLAALAATVLAIAAALLVGTSLLGRSRPCRRPWHSLQPTLLAALSATVALGVGYTGPGASEPERALSDRRVDLWGDAVDLAEAHPWRGVGIGQFPVASPTARADADTRFAHSLALELAAEGGSPRHLCSSSCLALLAAAASLGATPVLGIWAVTVFAAQASIDYTYRFPAVVLAAALVAGLTAARAPRSSPVPSASRADP